MSDRKAATAALAPSATAAIKVADGPLTSRLQRIEPGFEESSNAKPGHFVIERAFVD